MNTRWLGLALAVLLRRRRVRLPGTRGRRRRSRPSQAAGQEP
jgi:hypothetical protein